MRIGVDIRELEKGKMTGIGRYILNFLGYVATYDRKNEYILFGNQKTFCPVSAENITLKIIPEFNKIYWDQIVLANQIRKEKLNLFFSPYYKFPIAAKVKKIVTAHDVYPFLKFDFEPLFKNFAQRCCYKVMFYNADLIIAVSEHLREEILKVCRLNPGKIKVIYNSVEDRFRVMDKNDCFDKIKRLYGIDREFILYVGNLKPHKNLERLIQAYGRIGQDFKNKYQLVISAGKDKFFPGLEGPIEDLGLKKDVVFTGMVKDDALVYLYNAASLYISISLYEGFGLPFAEAMACACPVIASNAAAIPEIVKDAAVLVDPYDICAIARAIERLLEDKLLRQDLINKGLLRAKDFSVKMQVEKIISTFN